MRLPRPGRPRPPDAPAPAPSRPACEVTAAPSFPRQSPGETVRRAPPDRPPPRPPRPGGRDRRRLRTEGAGEGGPPPPRLRRPPEGGPAGERLDERHRLGRG